jgi:hypothetical protein
MCYSKRFVSKTIVVAPAIWGTVRFRGTYRFRPLKGEGPLVRASSPTISRPKENINRIKLVTPIYG